MRGVLCMGDMGDYSCGWILPYRATQLPQHSDLPFDVIKVPLDLALAHIWDVQDLGNGLHG